MPTGIPKITALHYYNKIHFIFLLQYHSILMHKRFTGKKIINIIIPLLLIYHSFLSDSSKTSYCARDAVPSGGTKDRERRKKKCDAHVLYIRIYRLLRWAGAKPLDYNRRVERRPQKLRTKGASSGAAARLKTKCKKSRTGEREVLPVIGR